MVFTKLDTLFLLSSLTLEVKFSIFSVWLHFSCALKQI